MVRNNAGVFQPTNQNHRLFFAQIWNQQIKVRLYNDGFCQHKNDNSSHKPARESTLGSWYYQQGLQKGSESFS